MKKINLLVIVVFILMITSTYTRLQQLKVEHSQLQEKYNQVISIFDSRNNLKLEFNTSDEKIYEVLKEYPECITISDSEFEKHFKLTECQGYWYTDKVKDFLKTEKTEFRSWNPEDGYEYNIFGGDFIMSYRQEKDGIKLLFSNQIDNLKSEMKIQGALYPKEVYVKGASNRLHLYYLIFQRNNELIAISQDMTMYTVELN